MILGQCHKNRKSDCYVIDKGYDSEAIHRLIRDDLRQFSNSCPHLEELRALAVPAVRKWLTMLMTPFIHEVNSWKTNSLSTKKTFSGDLKARRFIIQMKGIADKMIAGNIHRFLRYFIVKVFYRADT